MKSLLKLMVFTLFIGVSFTSCTPTSIEIEENTNEVLYTERDADVKEKPDDDD